jgi:DDE family transposase
MAFSFSGIVVVTTQSHLPERRPSSVSSHSALGQSSRACTAEAGDLEEADISGLLSMLASVTDPRDRRGRQYPLEFILAVCVVATLAGAANYREIGSHAADMPQELLKKLEVKWSWFKLRYNYPSKSAIRYVLIRIDAAVLDAITCAWTLLPLVRIEVIS